MEQQRGFNTTLRYERLASRRGNTFLWLSMHCSAFVCEVVTEQPYQTMFGYNIYVRENETSEEPWKHCSWQARGMPTNNSGGPFIFGLDRLTDLGPLCHVKSRSAKVHSQTIITFPFTSTLELVRTIV